MGGQLGSKPETTKLKTSHYSLLLLWFWLVYTVALCLFIFNLFTSDDCTWDSKIANIVFICKCIHFIELLCDIFHIWQKCQRIKRVVQILYSKVMAQPIVSKVNRNRLCFHTGNEQLIGFVWHLELFGNKLYLCGGRCMWQRECGQAERATVRVEKAQRFSW